MIHYKGQYGEFDYDPDITEPVIDIKKAAAFDEESGATLELWDYDKNDTLHAAHDNPSSYDFLVSGWNFSEDIPSGYHKPRYEDVDIEF